MCARSEEGASAPATETNSSSSAAVSVSLPIIEPNRWTTGSAPASPPTVTSRLAASLPGPGRATPGHGEEPGARELVRPCRRPLLPGGDQRRRELAGPLEMERGGGGLGHRAEREARDHTEALGPRAAQRPEQVLVPLLVALHQPSVGHDYFCRD